MKTKTASTITATAIKPAVHVTFKIKTQPLMKTIATLLLTIALSCLYTSTAQATILTNGSFETDGIITASTSLTGWSVTAGNIDARNSLAFAPYAGTYAIDLVGNLPGTIEQTFATNAGATYTLSFAYANNPAIPTASALVTVLDTANATLLSQSFTHSGSAVATMNYNLFSQNFVADSATTKLRFTNTFSTANGGVVLDAVGVVPEPGSATLLLGSLGMLAARRRRSA